MSVMNFQTTGVPQVAATPESTETLIRQVDSMIARDMSGNNEIGPMVSYSKLYTFASKSDKILMTIGWSSASIAGFGMPSFVFLIGNIIDSFNPTNSPDSTLDTINRMSLIFTLIGLAIWVTSYTMYSFLLIFSERVARKTRTAYLKSILS